MPEYLEFYDEKEMTRLENRVRSGRAVTMFIAAAILAFGIFCCVRTTTANAVRMEITAAAVTIAAGWILIYWTLNVVPLRMHELEHARGLQDGMRIPVTGTVFIPAGPLQIPNSVLVYPLSVETETGTERVLLCASRVRMLRNFMLEHGSRLTLYTRHGCAAACRTADPERKRASREPARGSAAGRGSSFRTGGDGADGHDA